MSEHDTQFVGFAKLLWEEILGLEFWIDTALDDVNGDARAIIARRTHDLVAHILNTDKLGWRTLESIRVAEVPDMTQWPEVSNE